MPDNNIANQNTAAVPTVAPVGPAPAPVSAVPSTAAPSRVGAQAEADSPWNEPLPEETPKPQVAGTLTDQSAVAPVQPFNLPPNVEKTMPPVVKAADLTSPATNQGTPQPVDSISSINPAFNYNYDQNQKNSVPLSNNAPVTNNLQTQNPPASIAKPIDSISGVAALVTKPAPQIPLSSQPVNADILPPLVQPQPVLSKDERSFTVPDLPATTPDTSAVVLEKRSGLSQLFAGLKRQPKEAAQPAKTSAPPESPVNSGHKSKIALFVYIILGIFIIFGSLIYLTEAGVLSIGLEKVYGAVSLEKLWGGLSKDSETALVKSLVTMQDHQKFKVSGTINLNSDKTIQNAVTTPLVSEIETVTQLAVLPIKAILTAYTTSTDSSTIDPDTSASSVYSTSAESATTATTDLTETTPTDSATTATTDPNSIESVTTDSEATTPVDQATESAFVDTTPTKTINATVVGSFGDGGNDMEVTISKPIGSETIDLKNSKNNFWVRSDQINFSDQAQSGQWFLYNLAALSNESVVSQTLAIDSSKGFSAGGTRQANERVGSVRCYKYSLDSVELGNLLSGIGVLSDSIQNISGTVWIGIKDKLIRRLDLKITTAPSSPLIQINISLNLSDYDTDNNFAAPATIDVVDIAVPTETPVNGE